ncbi:MAG: hypothetical protein R3F60_03355 [bacterium]
MIDITWLFSLPVPEREAFVAALEGPDFIGARRRYADLIAPRDPGQAEWLRLHAAALAGEPHDGARLAILTAQMPEPLVRAFARSEIHGCGAAPPDADRRARFRFECSQRWESLSPRTETERFCEACQETVHLCPTVAAVRTHAQAGHCVCIPRGLIAEAIRNMLGRPDPVADWAEAFLPPG